MRGQKYEEKHRGTKNQGGSWRLDFRESTRNQRQNCYGRADSCQNQKPGGGPLNQEAKEDSVGRRSSPSRWRSMA